MTRWLVIVEQTNYPYNGSVEADTVEEALAAARVGVRGRVDRPAAACAIGVVPAEQVAWIGEQWCVDVAHEPL
jgi:hypothetical protein